MSASPPTPYLWIRLHSFYLFFSFLRVGPKSPSKESWNIGSEKDFEDFSSLATVENLNIQKTELFKTNIFSYPGIFKNALLKRIQVKGKKSRDGVSQDRKLTNCPLVWWRINISASMLCNRTTFRGVLQSHRGPPVKLTSCYHHSILFISTHFIGFPPFSDCFPNPSQSILTTSQINTCTQFFVSRTIFDNVEVHTSKSPLLRGLVLNWG